MGTGIDWANDILQLLVVDDDLAENITWNGASYRCLVGSIEDNYNLEIAGIRGGHAWQIIILLSDFTSGYPVVGDPITYSSKQYRITAIEKDSTGAWYNMTISEDTR